MFVAESTPARNLKPLMALQRFTFRDVSFVRSTKADRLVAPSHPSRFSCLRFVSPAQSNHVIHLRSYVIARHLSRCTFQADWSVRQDAVSA